MDRAALDWVFSTAPQALAALVGLIFAGVAFIIDAINKETEKDETREGIAKEMKKEIHANMKVLFTLAGISIIADMLLLLLNPIEEGHRFSFQGELDFYLIISAIVLLVNVITFCYSLRFIIKVARPSFFNDTVKRLSIELDNGEIDANDYLIEWRSFDSAIRSLPIFDQEEGRRPLVLTNIVRKLRDLQYFNPDDLNRIAKLINTRNLIAHNNEIKHVDKESFVELKEYIRRINELKVQLSNNR